jgi:hypothetical protein
MDNGTQFWLYRTSGSSIYTSQQGTGAWTLTGNGTISNGSTVGFGTLNNTLILGDGVGSTRHTTTGTNFTNTTGAPVARYFEEYQRQIWAAQGTNPSLNACTTGDPTNWAQSGTSNGTTLTVASGGYWTGLMKVANRLIATKSSGNMYRWDNYSLLDMADTQAPTSALSIGKIEDYRIFLNRRGYFGFDGNSPTLISNNIQPQIYNNIGSGIVGGTFDTAPAIIHKYNYYASVGTVTDDVTRKTIPNAMQVYNYQLNTWRNYSMGTPISALWSYKDANLNEQLILGDNNGQCYTFGGTNNTDNGLPIEVQIQYVYHGGIPQYEKEWDYIWLFFNPGAQAHVQVAVGNTWTFEKLKWQELGEAVDGVIEYHFKSGERGRLLFVNIVESSRNAPFVFYGMVTDFDPVART